MIRGYAVVRAGLITIAWPFLGGKGGGGGVKKETPHGGEDPPPPSPTGVETIHHSKKETPPGLGCWQGSLEV